MRGSRAWLALLGVGITLLLGACGGGGGDEAGSSTLTVADRALQATAEARSADHSIPSVRTTFAFDSVPEEGVYLDVRYTRTGAVYGASWSQPTPLTGWLEISLTPPFEATPGTHRDTVTLYACYDQACRRHLRGSPATIAVTYEVSEAPPAVEASIDTSSVSIEARPGEAAQTLSVMARLSGPGAASLTIRPRLTDTDPQRSGIAGTEVVRLSDTERRIDVHLVDPDDLRPRQYSSFVALDTCYAPCSEYQQSRNWGINVHYRVLEFALQAAQKQASHVNDMVWDAVAQKFYLSFSASSADYANHIAVLDPSTGQITASFPVGGEPQRLAVSADGAYLYAALGAASEVRRLKLPGMTLDTTLNLSPDSASGRIATDLAIAPGQPRTLAVALSDHSVAIYDDEISRPAIAGGDDSTRITAITWAGDSSRLYGYDGYSGSFNAFALNVNADGASLARRYPGAFDWYRIAIHYANGLLYADTGLVLNPSTGSRTEGFRQVISQIDTKSLVLDVPAGRAYSVGRSSSDLPGVYRLTTFDLERQMPLRVVQLNLADLDSRRLMRWGADGLALINGQGSVYLLPSAAPTE